MSGLRSVGSRRQLSRALRRGSSALLLLAAAGGARGEGGGEADELESAQAFFEEMDADGSGQIELNEFLEVAREDVDFFQVPDLLKEETIASYERLFATADLTGDGSLDERELEYLWLLAKKQSEYIAEEVHLMEVREFERALGGLEKAFIRQAGGDGEVPLATAGATPGAMEAEEEVRPPTDWADIEGEALKAVVAQMDRDHDGKVDAAEFTKFLHDNAEEYGWQGYMHDREIAEWISSIFKQADVSGDGALDRAEVQYAGFLIERDIDSGVFLERTFSNFMFEELDTNSDGRVERAELDAALSEEASGFNAFEDVDVEGPSMLARIRDLFESHDEDGDGALDHKESLALATSLVDEL